jgi:23S rRNA (uracil1939-C5)-methyltransferase
VNRFLIDPLVEAAIGGAKGDTAIDLYSGVGLFAAALARSFRQVVAVESNSAATRDLKHNAATDTIQAEHTTAEAYLEAISTPPDFLLADPPRAGFGKPVVRRLLDLQPRAVTIVSCDPATLARDLPALLQGGYTLKEMILVDLFPQTYHFETIAKLTSQS